MKPASLLPFFLIIGRGRSGSSLLRLILSSHPSIAMPPESEFMQYLYPKYKDIINWDVDTRLNFWEDLQQVPKIDLLLLLHSLSLKEAILSEPVHSFAQMCQIVIIYSSRTNPAGIKWVGNKNVTHAAFIPKFMALFPSVKYIHIVRDYRATVRSFLKVKFELNSPSLLAYRWRYVNEQVLALKKQYPTRFYTLSYEKFVFAPEKYLKEICTFLEINYRKDLLNYLDYHQEALHQLSDLAQQFHSSLLKPLAPKRSDWAKKLTQQQLQIIEYVAGATGEQMGYKKAAIPTSIWTPIRALPGSLYGQLYYFVFERLLMYVPLSWQLNMHRHLLQRLSGFWKKRNQLIPRKKGI